MDLIPFVSKTGCECLNESDDCGFDNCLTKDDSYLESDCDEQVLTEILLQYCSLYIQSDEQVLLRFC